MCRQGFTLIELLVVTALVAVLALVALPLAEIDQRRDQEVRLRKALLEMRAGLDQFEKERDTHPTTFRQLVETKTKMGGFYLRRLPLNPMGGGKVYWHCTSQPSLGEAGWATCTSLDDLFPAGIVDVRFPSAPASLPVTAINNTRYSDW